VAALLDRIAAPIVGAQQLGQPPEGRMGRQDQKRDCCGDAAVDERHNHDEKPRHTRGDRLSQVDRVANQRTLNPRKYMADL
jgi:hypothetical protein